HNTLRPATVVTSAPRRTGTGILRTSGRTRSRARGRGAAAPTTRVSSIATTFSVFGAPQAQDREQERREEDLDPDDDERGREDRHSLLGEAAEPVGDPFRDDESADHGPRRGQSRSEEEAVLEAESGDAALEP